MRTHKHGRTDTNMQKYIHAHTETQSPALYSCAVINSEQSVCLLSSVAQDVGGVLSDFCHCMVKSLGHLDYKL